MLAAIASADLRLFMMVGAPVFGWIKVRGSYYRGVAPALRLLRRGPGECARNGSGSRHHPDSASQTIAVLRRLDHEARPDQRSDGLTGDQIDDRRRLLLSPTPGSNSPALRSAHRRILRPVKRYPPVQGFESLTTACVVL